MRLRLLVSMGLMGAACGNAPREPSGSVSAGIIGGAADEADRSVVLLEVRSRDGKQSYCTGTVIASHLVLTAAHCVAPESVGAGATFYLFLGSDVRAPAGSRDNSWVDVERVHVEPGFQANLLHRGHDLGVVVTTAPIPLAPVSIAAAAAPLDGADAVRAVGYGVTSVNDIGGESVGVRRSAPMPLTDVTDLFLEVGDDTAAPCAGDSGGPVFATVSGVESWVGVVSYGDESCASAVKVARLTASTEFVEGQIASVEAESRRFADLKPTGGCAMSTDASTCPALVSLLVGLGLAMRRRSAAAHCSTQTIE